MGAYKGIIVLDFPATDQRDLPAEKSAEFRYEPAPILNFTLPHNKNAKSERLEVPKIYSIPLNILLQLREPIVEPGSRNMRVNALAVLVPKAAPYFDDFVVAWKNKVRLSGKIGNVQTIPKSPAVNQTADEHFRGGVP
jgi:hypothetical protein